MKKVLTVLLVAFLIFNVISPVAIRAQGLSDKADLQINDVNAFAPQPRIAVAVVSATFAGITLAIRGIGSIYYATENHTYGSSESWGSLALSYFSGNAYKKPLADTRDTMIAALEITNQSIKDLEKQITTLQDDVNKLSAALAEIPDDIKAQELKNRLDDFYTGFFYPAYTNLLAAYRSVENALENPGTNEATLRAKLDDLFMKANELKQLDSYIVGTAFFDNTGILDVYYDYLLIANEVSQDGSDKYYEVANTAQDFTMKLFAASALQKLCTAYTSSYQLHYYHDHYDEMVENNDFLGYVVGGTSNLSTNKFTEYEIRENISHAYSDIQTVSGEIAKALTKIYMLDSYVGYVEEGGVYYAPVTSSKVKAYSGATYSLFSIPDAHKATFRENFTFVSDNSAVLVSDNGVFTFNGEVQTDFKISYVYGKDTLDAPITVYEITFSPSTRTFAGGYGHEKSPYLISNLTQLKDFASNSAYHAAGVHVRLTSDINLTGVTLSKISSYNGVFDGNGHTLYGTSDNYVLFNTNNGTIKNLTVSDATLSFSTSGSSIGGIIAITNTGKIINCHVKNSSMTLYSHNYLGNSQGVTALSVYLGAISSRNSGTIEYCSVDNVALKAEASSREAYNAQSGLSQLSFPDGTVIHMTVYVGGIAGENSGRVRNCYVEDTSINSKIYAAYYKSVILWESTINRVSATINSGKIIGANLGESDLNNYNKVASSTEIQKIAGNPNRVDESLVTTSMPAGNNGVNSTYQQIYLTSVAVSERPMQESYLNGDAFNFAGLKVVDNMGNAIYGYKLDGFNSTANGEHKIKLNYNGVESSFLIKVGCDHKHVRVDEALSPTCLTDGNTIGVYCLDCNIYVSPIQTIVKSNEYCCDNDSDHKCDRCDRALSQCVDNNSDHFCDVCRAEVSECVDADDHFCDICGNEFGECTDSDNHLCDICDLKISDCTDNDTNYRCDICGANLCSCRDDNNDHFCDICMYRVSDCYDNNLNHLCDVCNAITCTDFDKNHKCDLCSANVGVHKAGENTHICDYCNVQVSVCADLNFDHVCDVCRIVMSSHQSVEGTHNCSYCGQQMSNCTDANKDHFCDLCNTRISECEVVVGTHICYLCSNVVSNCVDINSDHLCDVCFSMITPHRDLNEDSKCDICGMEMKDSKNVALIVAVASGSTVGACSLVFGIWFLLRRKKAA